MKKQEIIFIFFLLVVFCSIFVSSEVQTLGTFKTYSCVTLKQTCGNCTFTNFTLSIPPNQTTFLINQTMLKISPTLWTYQFCNTSINGEYIYDTFGDPDGIITPQPVNFIINPLGKTLTNGQAILYFLVFFVSMIFFIICMGLGIYIPYNNSRDQMTGYVIAVENLKYFKLLMFAFSYILLILMSYFGWMISYGYLDMDFLGSLFNIAFYALAVCTLPLFILGFYIIVSNAVRDAEISDMLQRGLNVK